jgi:aryl-alcohol dehydrogenase-like predicted oxidoreductase
MERGRKMRRNVEALPSGPALGSWKLGGDSYWPEQPHTDSLKLIDAAIRGGIDHFDTAQVYGNGRSEQLLGQRLRKVEPPPFIATKLFPCPPSSVGKKIELSLKRLGREKIDLLYIHWPAGERDLRPLMDALESERLRGRIGLIGVSNFSVPEMEQITEAGRIDVCQIGHSLLWRLPKMRIIPWCKVHDIPLVAYSPLAQGLLAKPELLSPGSKALPFRNGDSRNRLLLLDRRIRPGVEAFFGEFIALTRQYQQLSPAQWALIWSFSQREIASVVIGTGKREHIEEAITAWSTWSAWKGEDPESASRDPSMQNKILAGLEDASERFFQYLVESLQPKDWENIFGHRPGKKEKSTWPAE